MFSTLDRDLSIFITYRVDKVVKRTVKNAKDDNSSHLYNIVVEFWTGNDNPPEFYKAKVCIVEKKDISAHLRTTGQYVSLARPPKLSEL